MKQTHDPFVATILIRLQKILPEKASFEVGSTPNRSIIKPQICCRQNAWHVQKEVD